MVSPAAKLSILAQGTGVLAGSLDQGAGNVDGRGSQAQISEGAVAIDPSGNLLQITREGPFRKISPNGVVSTVLRDRYGFHSGSYIWQRPAIAADNTGAAYIAFHKQSSWSSPALTVLERIAADGTVSEYSNTTNEYISGLAVDSSSGTLYLSTGNRIDRMSPQSVRSTWVGSGSDGYANGAGTSAAFKDAKGIALAANGGLFVADTGNHLIRRVSAAGVVSDFSGVAGQAGFRDSAFGPALFDDLNALSLAPDGSLVVLDNGSVRRVAANGSVTTLYKNEALASAYGVAVNAKGEILINTAEGILLMPPDQSPVLLAGQPITYGTAVDGSVSQAKFMDLREMTRDTAGNFYLSDGSSIRKIGTDGSVSTYAKNLANPGKMAADKKGNLYVIVKGPTGESEFSTSRILMIDSKGGVTTLADEGPLRVVGGIAVDMSDNVVYAVSSGEPMYTRDIMTCGAIRRISSGVTSTVAGYPTFPCSGGYNTLRDGNGTSAQFATIAALSISSTGTIYTADTYGVYQTPSSSYLGWRVATTDPAGNVTTISKGRLPITESLFTQVSGDLYSFNPTSIDKTRVTDCWWCLYDFTRSPNGKDIYAVGHNALLLIRP
ncbi:MAG: hypothetical protein IPO35_07710 [Uliginosibacterium sp.]|nr:hypothetical protein [Uliginosibacterium sp.]